MNFTQERVLLYSSVEMARIRNIGAWLVVSKESKRAQNGTGHYKRIKRVSQRATAGTTFG